MTGCLCTVLQAAEKDLYIINHKLIPRYRYLSFYEENRTRLGFLCLLYCSMLFSGIKLAIYN